MNDTKLISIIVPCRNEVGYIAACLDSVIANDYPREQLEILVVDGMSEDGTRSLVEQYSRQYQFIRLLENPKKIVPAALNLGIDAARGRIIVRMDAHILYPKDYLSLLVRWLEQSGADNVGGVVVTCPANPSSKALAIALGLSHPFGVGNSYFRIGAAEPRWVDTVPFGCYRREVFDHIGKFDEELVRNQDDEFNLRLLKHGGRILLVPEIVSHYYARDSLSKVWRMYYQYGYFKPLAARKLGGILTVRQVIPAMFLLSLFTMFLLGLWLPIMGKLWTAIFLAYAGIDVVLAGVAGVKSGIKCALWLCLVFPAIHCSYGLGFLKGALDFLIWKKGTPPVSRVPISR